MGAITVGGKHVLRALLSVRPHAILKVQVKPSLAHDALINVCRGQGIGVEIVKQCSSFDAVQNNQGVVCHIESCKSEDQSDFFDRLPKIENPLILIMDGIEDPHNLGACFRTAEAMGVDLLVFPKHNSASVNATVYKTSAGAVELVPFLEVTNLSRFIEKIKESGVWVYGTVLDDAAVELHSVDFSGACALVMGSEGKGIRTLTQKHCDGLCIIPLHGEVSSLNVSVATGIFLYEVNRQRIK
jgi:23S rRNA (guanosine2251-2'-O)-methyltransferase